MDEPEEMAHMSVGVGVEGGARMGILYFSFGALSPIVHIFVSEHYLIFGLYFSFGTLSPLGHYFITQVLETCLGF